MAKPLVTVSWGDARAYTNAVYELLDEGMLDKDTLIQEMLSWMSEYEVQELVTRSDLFRDEDNECIVRREEDVEEEVEE